MNRNERVTRLKKAVISAVRRNPRAEWFTRDLADKIKTTPGDTDFVCNELLVDGKLKSVNGDNLWKAAR